MFNRPQNLKEVKSLAVAKTLLHTFCKQSENHKETWNEFDQYYKEEDFKKENIEQWEEQFDEWEKVCLLYTSPSPRDGLLSRMPSSA